MRFEDLALSIPGDEFLVRFHEHLTILCGIGLLERQALADSIIGALTGNVEHTVVHMVDRTGRPVEIVSVGGVTECRYLDDDNPALPLVGTVAPTPDALRALMLVQAGDLGLTPDRVSSDDHPELAEARATLQGLTRDLEAAKSGHSVKEQLRDELAGIAAQIRQADESTARRAYASVLAELERVRAEASALQGGTMGADADAHLLESAEDARGHVAHWKEAADLVVRLSCHAPVERLDGDVMARARWYPEQIPSNFHALVDELADARSERDRLETRLRDLATSRLPEPSVPFVVDLATHDQPELWSAAEAVVETARALSREQVAMGGLSSAMPSNGSVDGTTRDVIARIEESHRVVEDLENVCDRRRVPAIAGAAIVAVASLLFVPVSPIVAVAIVAAAAVGALVSVGRPMRQLRAARRVEAEALADTDAPTYLGFHIRRVEASMTPGAHDRLEAATADHRAAVARWQSLAGSVAVEDAKFVETEVRAYAIALTQLGNTAGEVEGLRIDLSERAEPALARARAAFSEAIATYGLDEVLVDTAPANEVERLLVGQVERGRIARAQEVLEDAEADEEKFAARLDDLLHQLGFRDGTLDARAGALEWAVERAHERQEARVKARSRAEIEQDLTHLQDEARRLRRPEWATVQASDAEGPDVEELQARQHELEAQLADQRETIVDFERLADRHSAMERRVAALEAQIESEHPEAAIAQVADVQQYLLSHLTKAAHCGPRDEAVPVILDDPFVRIPAERKWELLDMLRRLGESTQLIYLTDDPFVSAWARRRASAGLITLLEPVDA